MNALIKRSTEEIRVSQANTIQFPSNEVLNIQANNSYLSQSCTGYINSYIKLEGDANIPMVNATAAIEANYDNSKKGNLVILEGEFINPFKDELETYSAYGIRLNSYLAKFYLDEKSESKKLYLLKNFEGFLISRFREESSEFSMESLAQIEVQAPVGLKSNLGIEGGYSFTNLFRSNNWQCIISGDLNKDNFLELPDKNMVEEYFENNVFNGTVKNNEEASVGNNFDLTFDFKGLSPELGNKYLIKVSTESTLFDNNTELKPKWKSPTNSQDGFQVYSVDIEVKTTTDQDIINEMNSIEKIDFQFSNIKEDIKLKATVDIRTNKFPIVRFINSTHIINVNDNSNELYVLNSSEIPLEIDDNDAKVNVKYTNESEVEIINKSEITEDFNCTINNKNEDNFYLECSTKGRSKSQGSYSNIESEFLEIQFMIPLSVDGLTINFRDNILFQCPKWIELEEIESTSLNIINRED